MSRLAGIHNRQAVPAKTQKLGYFMASGDFWQKPKNLAQSHALLGRPSTSPDDFWIKF